MADCEKIINVVVGCIAVDMVDPQLRVGTTNMTLVSVVA
jgi:hypothetical protein